MGKDKKEKADARLTNVDVSMHTAHEPVGAGATLIIRRAAKLHFASILIRPATAVNGAISKIPFLGNLNRRP